MAIDPKTTTVKTLYLPDELAARISAFRFAHEFRTEAEAMRHLLEVGLEGKGGSKRDKRRSGTKETR